jgi:methylenetetrahydrofolate dehydrogenase (NADP+)/methenyltetrahydrofolate cyclohydrolase
MTQPQSSIETVVLDGLALAQTIRGEIADEVQSLIDAGGRAPCLAVVLVGDDPASRSYIKGKQRACARVGMNSVEHLLPADTSEEGVLKLVDQLNNDDSIDGILVQVPLPSGISASKIAEATSPAKDADGIHPLNSGRLLAGSADLVACTPLGIIEVLDRHGVEIEGADAVVIGRSAIVGKPISILLQQRNATVTMCHSRTRDLAGICRRADIVVAATGRPKMLKADWIKPGAAVIDVGVTEVAGELVGDVDFEALKGIASLLTPSRRGIGPMTITMLLRNTLVAHRARTGA